MSVLGDMVHVAWLLLQSPLIWCPLLTATLVWVFMAGVKIGEYRALDRLR